MTASLFYLGRLRVLKNKAPAYDEQFHLGVNIIHGENGSGKSTIADFIFYILGGQFDSWKTEAQACDEVQAELHTKLGTLTLKRNIDKPQTPIQVYFGPMKDAERHGLDGWETYPIQRSDTKESFSQILFRSAGIPEAQSQESSNITMHQLLRLLYSDQRTPPGFLFRYENFDTAEIREAVGNLTCGLNVYEYYEIELALRALRTKLLEAKRRLASLMEVLASSDVLLTVGAIDQLMAQLLGEYEDIKEQIEEARNSPVDNDLAEFSKARSDAAKAVGKCRNSIEKAEEAVQLAKQEHVELLKFIEYLNDLSDKLEKAETVSQVVGSIDFTHCPACLKQ